MVSLGNITSAWTDTCALGLVRPPAACACPRARGTFALLLALVSSCSQRLVKLTKFGKGREKKRRVQRRKLICILCLLQLVALLSSWGLCEKQFSCDQTNKQQHGLQRLDLSGLLAVRRYLVLINAQNHKTESWNEHQWGRWERQAT